MSVVDPLQWMKGKAAVAQELTLRHCLYLANRGSHSSDVAVPRRYSVWRLSVLQRLAILLYSFFFSKASPSSRIGNSVTEKQSKRIAKGERSKGPQTRNGATEKGSWKKGGKKREREQEKWWLTLAIPLQKAAVVTPVTKGIQVSQVSIFLPGHVPLRFLEIWFMDQGKKKRTYSLTSLHSVASDADMSVGFCCCAFLLLFSCLCWLCPCQRENLWLRWEWEMLVNYV